MNHRKFNQPLLLQILGVGVIILMSCIAAFAVSSQERIPNIIFILADDLGYGDLGSYGQQRIKTPNIDIMAQEGIRFTQHYAGSTICAPSRCSLMTGLHTGHCRVRINMGTLKLSDVTVAEWLKRADYTTAHIGKWGLGRLGTTGMPTRKGFDYFYGYLKQRHAHNYYPPFLIRNEKRVPLKNKMSIPSGDGSGVASEKVEYSHDLLIEDAIAFIENNRNHYFFLYLALTIPHANNEAGRNGMEVPSYGIYTDKRWPEPQKGHAAMITRMDTDIGRLLGKLKELDIDEHTLVMFSSDNGPHREGGTDPEFNDSNGPFRGIKHDLYEGGIRVPFIARWPGKIQSGRTSDHVSAFWDLLPTFCELAGIPVPDDTDGISMVPTLLGQENMQKKHEYLYWELEGNWAVRMGNWKAVRIVKRRLELYDLSKDLQERNDLYWEQPNIVDEIERIRMRARSSADTVYPFPLFRPL